MTTVKDSTPHHSKALSETSFAPFQYSTSSTANTPRQGQPNRQRSVTEHSSSLSTSTNNLQNKKVRK